MKIADFDAGSFFNKVQKSVKVSHSTTPQLTLSSTKDKFVLNPAGQALLGVFPENKDRVMIMDLNIGEENNPENQKQFGERFYIAKNLYMTDNKKGLISKNGEFAYTTVWAAMLKDDPAITQIPHADLVADGLVLERKGPKYNTCISYTKIVFDIERVESEDGTNEYEIVPGGKPQPVFALTNFRKMEHVPEIEDDVEEVED